MKLTRQGTLSIGLAGLLIGLFTDILVRQEIFGLNFLLWTSLWSLLVFVTAYIKRKLTLPLSGLTLIAFMHSALVYFRSEPIVQFWSFIIAFISLAMISGYLTVSNYSRLPLIKKFGEIIASCVLSITVGFKTMYRSLGVSRKKSRISPGLIVALSLAFIFIILFSGSDEIFRNNFSWVGSLIDSVTDFINAFNLGRLYTITLFSLISVGLISLLILESRTVDDSDIKPRLSIKKKDAVMILGTVLAIFVFYLIIQARYLIAGANLPEGLTYASYARRGYGELLLATLLASAVVQVVVTTYKDKNTKFVKIIGSLLVLANSMVILTAWKRLSLYESAYGFTMARFIAKLGLICLAIGSALLIVWIMGYLSTRKLFITGWLTIFIVLTLSSFINPATLIVKHNITLRSQREVPLDTRYILSLSRDSWPALCAFAPTLKSEYPDEYLSLKNNFMLINSYGSEYKIENEPINKGLSAHFTHSRSYLDSYKSCLE